MLSGGYINSVFGQKGCLKTTDGYNYMALEDDVWVYTGVTSVTGDRSIVGFVLMNQRTTETRYYEVNGPRRIPPCSPRRGRCRTWGIMPLSLSSEYLRQPTYFMALKDDAGLVKKYAMVNIQKYQNVAIGDTVAVCEETYVELLASNGFPRKDTGQLEIISGTITRIAQSVIDGNSHFYLVLEGSDLIFDVPVHGVPAGGRPDGRRPGDHRVPGGRSGLHGDGTGIDGPAEKQ